jgi:drug/metabolite transporter (DMT)-like permease
MGLSVEMPTLDWTIFTLLSLSALGSAVGNYILVVVNKTAEASLIAPLVYSQLISATVLGVVVFGEWPDVISLCGLGLILLSGFGSLLAHQRATPL